MNYSKWKKWFDIIIDNQLTQWITNIKSYWKINLRVTEDDFKCVKRLLWKRELGKSIFTILENRALVNIVFREQFSEKSWCVWSVERSKEW